MGDTAAAIADYRTALRYNPQYEPARLALRRLGATETSREAPDPAEQRATELAEEAALAAKRGDYAGAARLLDEAEREAPRFPLVHQYRSNVAYLMGDVEGAKRALRRGLELEPDNQLFLENLRRLGAKEKQP
jgi:tetratricopeptide (TPR) repeat protein